MILANPSDGNIRNADGVMLMDSARGFYETVGVQTHISRSHSGEPDKPVDHLTIIVDSADAKTLEEWSHRINHIRGELSEEQAGQF